MLPFDQWTAHPAQATRPASWPALLPFLPDVASRTMETATGQGACWLLESRAPTAEEQQQRDAMREAVTQGNLARALGTVQQVLERLSAAPAPEHARALEALQARVVAAVEASGATPVATPAILSRLPGAPSRVFQQGVHLLTISATPHGSDVGVVVYAHQAGRR